MRRNIILIGMPGSGKSTVGVILAKTLGYDFIDTDIYLIRRIGMTLQAFIDKYGIGKFLLEERKAALSLDCENTVIATGGSMVLSDAAMSHMRANGISVFLDVPLDELRRRLTNIKTRGIVLSPGETIDDIYRDRLPLYRKFADIKIDLRNGQNPDVEAIVQSVINSVANMR